MLHVLWPAGVKDTATSTTGLLRFFCLACIGLTSKMSFVVHAVLLHAAALHFT